MSRIEPRDLPPVVPATGRWLELAAARLRAGRLVVFPTETVYGLGASVYDATAVAQVYAAKGRPARNPLIVHVATAREAWGVARPTRLAEELATRFWPGPLTLVLAPVPSVLGPGWRTVAVRVPDHPVARSLLSLAARPVAAPSANRSGRPSPTTAADAARELAGRDVLVVDGGPCRIGVESTVLDLTRTPPALLRPGGVTVEELEEAVGEVVVAGDEKEEDIRSPGTHFRHYAPACPVEVYDSVLALEERVRALRKQGVAVGVLASRPLVQRLGPPGVSLGEAGDAAMWAKRLFAGLRRLEESGVSRIVAQLPGEEGLGRAVRERLLRAAQAWQEGGAGPG